MDKLLAKIKIEGTLEVLSGLHIGAGDSYSAIGTVDNRVVRDSKDNPYIPGSSFKGKMRHLLEKIYCNDPVNNTTDEPRIEILFGTKSISNKEKKTKPGILQFNDMTLENASDYYSKSPFEVKFENTIDKFCEAKPRQIERVVPGAQFKLELIYDYYEGQENNLIKDFELIAEGLYLLTIDYLGGSGTRGYGRVKFIKDDFKVTSIFTQEPIDSNLKDKCLSKLKNYENMEDYV